MRNWPTIHEYDDALLKRRTAFSDPDIQQGHLEISHGKPARLNDGGSEYVCVYRVGNFVVRCFASNPPDKVYPPDDIVQRYQGITAFLQNAGKTLPFLVPHQLVENPGIQMKGASFPYLKVPYIDSMNSKLLGDFLSDHYSEQQTTRVLAQEWFKLIQQLESVGVAHGDLDPSNILVCGRYSQLSLRLIDFDGMYIPAFNNKHMSLVDKGHEHFQPAQAGIRTFGPTMDRFSALVIQLSLCALEMKPSLWVECEASDRNFLLSSYDFERLSQSKNFPLLRKERNNQRLQLCLDELQESIDKKRMPRRLTEILHQANYVPASQTTQHHTGWALPIPLDAGVEIPTPQPSYDPWPGASQYPPLTPPPGRGRITQRSKDRPLLPVIIAIVSILIIIIVILGITGHL